METMRHYIKLMLKRRGYVDIVDDGENIIADGEIIVFFVKKGKLTIDVVKFIINQLGDITKVIVAYGKSLTPDAKNILSLKKALITFETFHFDELMYDPIRYKVEKEEQKIKKLPLIHQSDIVCRYYNFQPGDVIRIEEDTGYFDIRRVI